MRRRFISLSWQCIRFHTSSLAHHARISRPTTYRILDHLAKPQSTKSSNIAKPFLLQHLPYALLSSSKSSNAKWKNRSVSSCVLFPFYKTPISLLVVAERCHHTTIVEISSCCTKMSSQRHIRVSLYSFTMICRKIFLQNTHDVSKNS